MKSSQTIDSYDRRLPKNDAPRPLYLVTPHPLLLTSSIPLARLLACIKSKLQFRRMANSVRPAEAARADPSAFYSQHKTLFYSTLYPLFLTLSLTLIFPLNLALLLFLLLTLSLLSLVCLAVVVMWPGLVSRWCFDWCEGCCSAGDFHDSINHQYESKIDLVMAVKWRAFWHTRDGGDALFLCVCVSNLYSMGKSYSNLYKYEEHSRLDGSMIDADPDGHVWRSQSHITHTSTQFKVMCH